MAKPVTEVAEKAAFDRIRYAQLWEDADILCAALGVQRGKRLVSIASAGDNALAMLTLDPARVVAVDLSAPQIACLHLRVGAYRALDHGEFLVLMGARPSALSGARAPLLVRALVDAPQWVQAFWADKTDAVEAHGAGGIGKFETYFRRLRRWVLPFTHGQRTLSALFEQRDRDGRQIFYNNRFQNWRWRLLMRVFFSRFMMARLGRDPAFFAHAKGSVAEHVAGRLAHALVDTDPAQNPYLHWIVHGSHGDALPLAWCAEHFDTIRERLDRIEIHQAPLEAYLEKAPPADGFNLSDIFEYMSPEAQEHAYRGILAAANPNARLVYWNMMVPRRVPSAMAARVVTLHDVEACLKPQDKAFFYSDFVVEEVREAGP